MQVQIYYDMMHSIDMIVVLLVHDNEFQWLLWLYCQTSQGIGVDSLKYHFQSQGGGLPKMINFEHDHSNHDQDMGTSHWGGVGKMITINHNW